MATAANLNARRPWILAYAIPFQVVTTFLLAVRLISRYYRLGGRLGALGLDDAFIVVGWMISLGVTYTVAWRM
jgi:hypothetical protein